MANYTRPGTAGSLMSYESRYGNHIGGEWVPRSDEADIEKALDAAHAAASHAKTTR